MYCTIRAVRMPTIVIVRREWRNRRSDTGPMCCYRCGHTGSEL